MFCTSWSCTIICCINRFTSLCKNLFNLLEFLVEAFRCTWHREASAKNSSKLNKFLHSEVNLLIQHNFISYFNYLGMSQWNSIKWRWKSWKMTLKVFVGKLKRNPKRFLIPEMKDRGVLGIYKLVVRIAGLQHDVCNFHHSFFHSHSNTTHLWKVSILYKETMSSLWGEGKAEWDVNPGRLSALKYKFVCRFKLAVDMVRGGVREFEYDVDGPAFLKRDLVWTGTGRLEFMIIQVV